jgi:GT2 family glycosyltransferase
MRFLPDLFKSLSNQTYRDFNILVIDNGSTDGVEAYIREHYPEITILRNARNLGFSGAHNQGIRYALEHWEPSSYKDNFVLVTNPDLILPPNFVETLMRDVSSHPTVGAFGGKLRRAFGENLTDEALQETIQSDLIDSTGLHAHKNRSFTDRGAGEMDKGQYDESRDVFGISGALVLYRAAALDDIRFEDEFFDEDFFAYKEDVDLAWRLQRFGWDARFVSEAVAFHYRGMYAPEKIGIVARIKNRRNKSKLRSYYSNRNQWLLLAKDLPFIDFLFACVWIVPSEIGRFIFTLLFETRNTLAFIDAVKLFPRMFRKRLWIKKHQKRSSKELRRWFK